MSLPPSEIQYEEAHINQTRQPACYAVTTIFYAAALFFVGLRLVTRKLQRLPYALDDYIIMVATVRVELEVRGRSGQLTGLGLLDTFRRCNLRGSAWRY